MCFIRGRIRQPTGNSDHNRASDASGISVRINETHCRKLSTSVRKFYDLHSSILRFSNVYGPRQDADGEGGVVSIFSDRIQKGTPPMIYGDGDQTRDFIFVEDVARAVVAGLSVKENLCVNVSSQTAISINDLFQLMKDVSGSDLEVYYGPKRSGDIRHSMLSNEKAKELLHWKPEVSLKDGLRMTLRALKRRKREAV
nr:GDP-mannose 4,6-dehydratase [Sporolactobacillus inulinus]